MDAISGDTLLIPVFDSIDGRYYSSSLPSNNYTVTISSDTIGLCLLYERRPDIRFAPLCLTKSQTGCRLSILNDLNIEYAISQMSNMPIDSASTYFTDIMSASLFFRLRNDIAEFCISGNGDILLEDVYEICEFEAVIKQDLDKALRNMDANAHTLTEQMVVPFLQSLSRCVYMNLLKDAILSGRYNEYIGNFGDFYMPTMLPYVLKRRGMNCATANYIYNQSYRIGSDNTYDSSTLQINILNDQIYGCSNFLHNLLLTDYVAHAHSFERRAIEIQNRRKDLLKELENFSEMSIHVREAQRESIIRIIEELRDKLAENDGDDNIVDAVNKAEREFENNWTNFGDSICNHVSELTRIYDSLEANEALAQADKEFEILTKSTLETLYNIIKANRFNVYNGEFISICDNLYAVGAAREYDMTSYKAIMDSIDASYRATLEFRMVKMSQDSLNHMQQRDKSLATSNKTALKGFDI